MKKISIVFVAALSLAAFGCAKSASGSGEAAYKDRPVLTVARQSTTVWWSRRPPAAGMDDKMNGKMKDVAMSHCKDDKWSDDVVQCMSEAKTDTDFQTCQGRLTPEQKDGVQKAMKDLKTAGGGMAPPVAMAGYD